jgi:hypothetical protein
MAMGVLVVGVPAMAQLQAPRPELTTAPPSAPGARAASTPDAGDAAPPPKSSATPSPETEPAPPPRIRQAIIRPRRDRPAMAGDGADDLNHREMERLRRTRPDIAPPTRAVPKAAAAERRPPAAAPSLAEKLNRRELGSRAADDP